MIVPRASKNRTERVVLVTGTLAEPAVRAMAGELEKQFGIRAEVLVLNIQVAALMTPSWLERKLQLSDGPKPDRIILPGYCQGDLSGIEAKLAVAIELGPCDVRDLPVLFGRTVGPPAGYGASSIEIIAEINHAPRLSLSRILTEADALAADGADVIDVGCDPHCDRPPWQGVGDVVAALVDRGLRVSVDSFHAEEVAIACKRGAQLVLSVNSGNVEAAAEWGAQVVVVPDDPHRMESLEVTMARLQELGVTYRVDPVIEPIGFGFAQSLGRYLEVRRRLPDAPMMMGIGNLTEMTGVDSAAVNALLVGFCQELGIHSVLTTQVIPWACSSVREIDIARRLMHHAVENGSLPKHVDDRLIMLRDARLREIDPDAVVALAAKLTDRNVRIFADPHRNTIHAMNRDVHAQGPDPFELFRRLGIDDAAHAFYLGYEMAKAVTALTLGKNYTQDEPLDWGMLTRSSTLKHPPADP